ncbi:transcriptional Coactivator p15-domain-containing protein [Xylariaceae sp. FL0804]|nr:transcriptional Coactivator p15-domain-containing protein [Xylariaceae sp. FL0804]
MAGLSKKRRAREEDRDDDDAASSDEGVKSIKKTKKVKLAAAGDSGKDEAGNCYWNLAPTRRVTVSEFKGNTYVNLREYYTDNAGNLKPTKKGLSLTLEQYDALVGAIPAISAELQAQGHETPNMGGAGASRSSAKKGEGEKTQDKTQKKKKANIEATSDEDEPETD